MKGELGLDLLGRFVLVLAAVAVGVLILTTQGNQPNPSDSVQLVQDANYPICGDYQYGETVDRQTFESLIYARHVGNCEPGNTTVDADFVLAQDYIDDFVATAIGTDENDNPQILRTDTCEPVEGFEGVVSGFTNETIAFRSGTRVNISSTQTGGVTICPATA